MAKQQKLLLNEKTPLGETPKGLNKHTQSEYMTESKIKTRKELKKEAWKEKQKLKPVKITQAYCKKNRLLLKLTCLAIDLASEHKKAMLDFANEQIYQSFLIYKEPAKLSEEELEAFDQGMIRFFIHFGWIANAPDFPLFEIRKDWVYKFHIESKGYLPHIHINWLKEESYKQVKEYLDLRSKA